MIPLKVYVVPSFVQAWNTQQNILASVLRRSLCGAQRLYSIRRLSRTNRNVSTIQKQNKIDKVINLEKHTRVSSGSSAGGGGSNLPTRKCSIPVQAIITPVKKEQDVSLHTRASWCTLKQFQVNR